MVALAADLVKCFERSEERWEREGAASRKSAPLQGVSAAWLKNIFEMIFRSHRKATKSVLYRVFQREVERKLNHDADQYLEERLWAIVEEACSPKH